MQILGPKRLNRALGRNLADKGGAIDLFSSAPLDLRFALQKTLDPRVTFTRASTGTYVGSDGVLRSAVTNLAIYSEQFNDASWTKTNSTITANTVVSPDGLMTGDSITSSVGLLGRVEQTISQTTSTTYTLSTFAKANQYTFCQLRITGSVVGVITRAYFNLTTGAITGAANCTASITPVGNGWYRCSITYTTISTAAAAPRVYGQVDAADTVGDGTSGIYLWGAQMEASATLGDYIPTTSTINSAPRFDHNPTTGESLGLLVEEARTNLILQSEDLSTSWTNINTTETTNAATAPDGTTTADKLVETAVTGEHSIRQDSTSQAAGTYTFSIFAKAAERTFLQFAATGVLGSFRANFNIGAGTLGSSDSELITSIVPYGNGWYKCIVTRTTTAAGTLRSQWNIVTSSTAARVESYAGDGTSGLLLWGAQLEAGAFATSYIPTTTATVTRAADVASITGTNFSSWYNQTEGTLFGEGTSTNSISGTTARVYALASNAATTEIFSLEARSATSIRARVLTGGVTVSASDTYNVLGKNSKVAGAYGSDGVTVCADGRSPVTSASSISTPDALYLGANALGAGASCLNGTIKRITYWPVRLANTTLQSISAP